MEELGEFEHLEDDSSGFSIVPGFEHDVFWLKSSQSTFFFKKISIFYPL